MQRQAAFGRRSDSVGQAVALGGVIARLPSAADATRSVGPVAATEAVPVPLPVAPRAVPPAQSVDERVFSRLLDRIDSAAVAALSKAEVAEALHPLISEILSDLRITLNRSEQNELEQTILHELVGLGPLEPLLADPSISDILVNGPDQVYVERNGKLEPVPVRFRDREHLFQIAQRICNQVGRRIDQSSPLADARLEDGSRVNIVSQPLSLRGPALSIRKFNATAIGLEDIAASGGCSEQMLKVLRIAAACRLNIIISGGTGSGKTTLLNALSQLIDPAERVITIEDTAELRLQQPHVVTLETRPMNVEGQGAVSVRDLVSNALRMRPDRIILGEIRGPEAFDLLAAMNTGHDGSMCTLHANSPREALMRLENMVLMSALKVSRDSIVRQIAESVDLIVQIKRLRDGSRRITSLTEVTGYDGETLLTQELFRFDYVRELANGQILGEHTWTGNAPHCHEKARQFERALELREACQ